jgi:hypothetical protein
MRIELYFIEMSFKLFLSEFETESFDGSFVRRLSELLTQNFQNSSKKIHEFDIQFMNESETEEKVVWEIVQNNYLLLNKQFVKSVYFYARERFLKLLHIDEFNNEKDLNALSLIILMVNPNFSTAWSYRKTLFLRCLNKIDKTTIEQEFYLNKLVLKKHFKCEQAFVHRRWMIKLKFDMANLETFLCEEIDFLIDTLSKRVKANYYCWTFTNWIIEFALANVNNKTFINAFLYEKIFSTKSKSLLYENPSDFCVFHFRLHLFKLFYLNTSDNTERSSSFFQKIIFDEIALTEDLLLRYANYSTVWNYLKYFLIFSKQLLKVSDSSKNSDAEILRQSWSQLKESFSTNSDAVFSNQPGFNEQINQMFASSNDEIFKNLIKRELIIGETVATLFKSNNRDSWEIVHFFFEKFAQFIHRFIFV